MAAGIPHQILTWLTSASSYTGSDGALVRLGQHLEISAAALAVGAILSIPLGVLLARMRRGGFVVTSFANAARAVPILGVLILLAVGALGVGTTSAVVALVIFAIPPMLTNTFTGVRNVDADTRRAAVGMGMTRRQVTWSVDLPLAIPLIATGVRLAVVQVWATATLAAIVGSGGLGQLVVTGYAIRDYGEVYGGVIIVVITALLLDGGLGLVERAVRRRYGDVTGASFDRRPGNSPASVPA